MAQGLQLPLDEIKRFDRLPASAEARRDAVLRELERYRTVFAEALRRAAENIRHAEFNKVHGGKSAA
jgi:hypothetical protein